MEIQPFEQADIEFLSELQPKGWPELKTPFQFYIDSKICFPVKVILNDKIIGVGASILHENSAWLAHIIVHPNNRNRGVGQKITQALVDSLIALKCETILLIATELGEPVYKKVGFNTETEYLSFKGVKMEQQTAISDKIISFSQNYSVQIMSLDREVSGENRWVQLKEYVNTAILYIVDDVVQGYYLPDWGEGLIVASNPAAGIELMKIRLKTNGSAILPIDNKDGMEFLLNNHFVECKRMKRMRLGGKGVWKPESLYNRIAGSLG